MMLDYMPDIKQYGYNNNTEVFRQAWNSSVYGGNVLCPVGSLKRGRTKNNPLEADIRKYEPQTTLGGDYFRLMQVREAPTTNHEMDIFLLTDRVDDMMILKKFKAMNQWAKDTMNRKLSPDELKSQKTSELFVDISDAINGFARIVTYANHSIPEYQDINRPLKGVGSGEKVISHKSE